MSVAQTTAKIHSRVCRPASAAEPSHNSRTQGNPIHSAPRASHWGSRSRSREATQRTTAAPAVVTAIAAAVPAITAATTARTTVATNSYPAIPSRPPRHRRAHSQAIPTAASAVTIGSQGEPNQAAATAIGASTSADRIRSASRLGSARAKRGTVTAFAAAIVGDRLLEIGAPEIRPQRLGEDEFGVSALPQQEIADALLAAGANQKVGIGKIDGEQMRGNQLLVDRIERQSAGFNLGGDGARRR